MQFFDDFFVSGDPMTYVLFGVIGLFVLRWIVSIIKVAIDSYRRSSSLLFQLVSVILITLLTPLLGWPLYKLIRPKKRSNQDELSPTMALCKKCKKIVLKERKFCSYCGEHNNKKCLQCENSYHRDDVFCFCCGAKSGKLPKTKKKKGED